MGKEAVQNPHNHGYLPKCHNHRILGPNDRQHLQLAAWGLLLRTFVFPRFDFLLTRYM